MLTYIPKFLKKINHPKPKRLQKAHHEWTEPIYGQKRQFAKTRPELPTLDKLQTSLIQQKAGSMLYYGRAMDYTMLPA